MRTTFITLLSLAAQLHGVESFWRMICDRPIVTARMDPIISPGAIAGHTHAITGASGVKYDATYADLRASECTTCQVTQDLSAYWVPQLYYTHEDGTYEVVEMVTGITVYYLPRGDPGPAGKILAIPDGLRMIAGDPFRRSYNESDLAQRAIGFSCLGGVGYTKSLQEITNCANGLRGEIFFPNCWDGVNLDSADHQSHMAYSGDDGNGKCPSSHPVKLVSIFFEAMFDVNSFKDQWWNGTTPPFVFAQGDPTGYGLHGDFMTGWDSAFLQTAVDTCTASSGLIQDCPVFDIDQKKASSCAWDGTLMTSEDVFGTTTSLAALPGCNPVNYGPAEAPIHPLVCPDGSTGAAKPAAAVSVATSATSPSTSISAAKTSSSPVPAGNVILAGDDDDDEAPSSTSSRMPSTTLLTVAASTSASPSTTSSSLSTKSTTIVTPTTSAAGAAQVDAQPKAASSTLTSTQVITNVINGQTSVYTTTIYVQETAMPSTDSSMKAASNVAVSNNGGSFTGPSDDEDSDESVVAVTRVVENIEYYTITKTLLESNTPYVQLYVIPSTALSNMATTVTSRSGPLTKTIYETVTATTVVSAQPVLASMAVDYGLPSMDAMTNATTPGNTTSVITRYHYETVTSTP